MIRIYDAVVIGSGPTGLGAGMYAGRMNMKTLVIGDLHGGIITTTDIVENYPGFIRLTGLELADKLQQHVEDYKKNVELLEDRVTEVKKEKDHFLVKTKEKSFETKTVIFATGTKYRELNVPGHDKYKNRGVHYCALCVLPKNIVISNPSAKDIEDIQENEKVLTGDGKFKTVVKKIKKKFNGEIIKIRPKYFRNDLTVTKDHLVLAARPKKRHHNYRAACRKKYGKEWIKHIKEFIDYEIEWKTAEELRKGDYLAYPIFKEIKDKEFIKISDFVDVNVDNNGRVYNKTETHSSVRVPNSIKIDKDFMSLVGYYLAEGHEIRGLHFSFNKKETKLIEEVKTLIIKVFGLKPFVDTTKNVVVVRVYSKILGQLFATLFGKLSHNKKLPEWFIYLPVEKLSPLVRTLLLGDGSFKRMHLHYVTTSKQLAFNLKIILLKLGIIPSFSIRKAGTFKGGEIEGRKIVSLNDQFIFEIGGPWLDRIAKMTGILHPYLSERKKSHYYAWFDQNYAMIPIRYIKTEKYSGPVYDLAVEDSHSFVTDAACVHNCDGFFYKEKVVGVVGGSDSAAKEALLMTQWAKKVFMIYRGEKIRPEPINMKRIEQNDKIEIITKTNVVEIKGDKTVKSVVLDNPYKGKKELELDGLFIAIGLIPLSDLAKTLGVKINNKGEIEIDRESKTNVLGVYAAGDITDTKFKQAITGVAEGVHAVYSAYTYINEKDVVQPT